MPPTSYRYRICNENALITNHSKRVECLIEFSLKIKIAIATLQKNAAALTRVATNRCPPSGNRIGSKKRVAAFCVSLSEWKSFVFDRHVLSAIADCWQFWRKVLTSVERTIVAMSAAQLLLLATTFRCGILCSHPQKPYSARGYALDPIA